jgi:hypothetical protein
MAISCAHQGGILRVDAEGEYGLADIRSALDAVIASPDFRAPMCVLADARRSLANPSADEVRRTAAYLGSIREHFLPTWIVVVQGSLRFGLARMLSAFARRYEIELLVHREFEEAERRARELAA